MSMRFFQKLFYTLKWTNLKWINIMSIWIQDTIFLFVRLILIAYLNDFEKLLEKLYANFNKYLILTLYNILNY